jgi:bifunctional DNase/RNase
MSDTGAHEGASEDPSDQPGAPGQREHPEESGQLGQRDPEVWRLVAVADVIMDLPASFPEIVLHESQDPWRELRIPVGLAEGTAIAYAFRSIAAPRPLTHDLLTELLDRHDISVEAVRITGRRGQLFHAEMDTAGPRGRQVVPCRPSDAIALALRQRMPTPVLVAEWIFSSTGDEDDKARPEEITDDAVPRAEPVAPTGEST